ncbi:hypothetical protein CsatA_009871 [Cannabis sativa]
MERDDCVEVSKQIGIPSPIDSINKSQPRANSSQINKSKGANIMMSSNNCPMEPSSDELPSPTSTNNDSNLPSKRKPVKHPSPAWDHFTKDVKDKIILKLSVITARKIMHVVIEKKMGHQIC